MSDGLIFVTLFFILPTFYAFYCTDAQWSGFRLFCAVFGHRWFFIVSTPTLESGEVFCKRCGKVEHHKESP